MATKCRILPSQKKAKEKKGERKRKSQTRYLKEGSILSVMRWKGREKKKRKRWTPVIVRPLKTPPSPGSLPKRERKKGKKKVLAVSPAINRSSRPASRKRKGECSCGSYTSFPRREERGEKKGGKEKKKSPLEHSLFSTPTLEKGKKNEEKKIAKCSPHIIRQSLSLFLG